MNLASILALLAQLSPVLVPGILKLEAAGVVELNALIANVSSPDLKLLLQDLSSAIDAFAKAEVAKLP